MTPSSRAPQIGFLLLVVALVSGCARPLACPRAVKVPEPPPPQQHAATVLFATDRRPEAAGKLEFSSELSPAEDGLSYGAKCEDPVGGGAGCRDETSQVLERDEFLRRVAAGASDVVLFVHGFRYSFDDSLAITLRLVQRAQVRAVPVAYSWPSQNKLAGYADDYAMTERTTTHLAYVIQQLVRALPAGARLHIVAQSMGNRALLEALAQLDLPKQRLGQLIMLTPDMNTQAFKDLVARSGPFQRKTVYVSNRDLALRASEWLHPHSARAGDAAKQYVVLKEMDTVDMSRLKAGVSGHSIYEFSQVLFDDVGAALKGEDVSARQLTACTVKSIAAENAAHGTSLPCVVHQLPAN